MLRVCSICLEPLRSSVVAIEACQHRFHRQCLQEWQGAASSGESPVCPLCRSSIEGLLETIDNDDLLETKMFARFVQDPPENPVDFLLGMGLQFLGQENNCYFVSAASEASRRTFSGVTRLDVNMSRVNNNESYADVVGFQWFFDFKLRLDARLRIDSGVVENLRYALFSLLVSFISHYTHEEAQMHVARMGPSG
jgi:hypothetical protein